MTDLQSAAWPHPSLSQLRNISAKIKFVQASKLSLDEANGRLSEKTGCIFTLKTITRIIFNLCIMYWWTVSLQCLHLRVYCCSYVPFVCTLCIYPVPSLFYLPQGYRYSLKASRSWRYAMKEMVPISIQHRATTLLLELLQKSWIFKTANVNVVLEIC